VRAAVLTISTSRSAGGGRDRSGPRLEALARDLNASEVYSELIPDDRDTIEDRLRRLADAGYSLILTSGGTGFTPDDVTPEATSAVLDRHAPGIAEAMRLASRAHSAYWMLSRGVAGLRGSALIVNFPGSPRAVEQISSELRDALRHALALTAGDTAPHGG
jgi:molybdenum cofactor synthesis domain-containing protein